MKVKCWWAGLLMVSLVAPVAWATETDTTTSRVSRLRLADADSPAPDPPKAPESSRGQTKTAPTAPATRTAPSIDEGQEHAALQLVRVHLPEIEPMLDRLRENNRAQYEQAIRDLAKSARRLEQVKKRDEALFEVEVEILKARSNVNLLTARLKLRDQESTRQALREAAASLQRAELARDAHDVQVLKERIAQWQGQLANLQQRLADKQTDFDSQLKKNYANYLRKAGRGARRNPARNNK